MGARIDPRSTSRASILAALVGASAAAISACSSESNPKPPDTTFTTSSSTTTGAGGAGGGSSSSSSATGTGGDGSGGAANCDGPNGCYSCPPKTGSQFLNACTSTQCSPFDNGKRLPLYNNGNLPPIP